MSKPATERTPLRSVHFSPINSLDSLENSRHGLLVSEKRLEGGESSSSKDGDAPASVHEWKGFGKNSRRYVMSGIGFLMSAILLMFVIAFNVEFEGGAWSAISLPFSTVSPASLGMIVVDRPSSSSPGPIFKNLVSRGIPLPTNSWCENFFLGRSNTGEHNKVFQVPYILDTAGVIQGVRTHPAHVQANDRAVMMTYELENGLALGAVETFLPQHEIVGDVNNAIARLAIVLEWKSDEYKRTGKGPHMNSPIVRGAPYTSMIYNGATPKIHAQRFANADPLVDGTVKMVCGEGRGVFSTTPITVTKEIKLQFDTSDMTWLVFVSEPTDFVCSNTKSVPSDFNLPPGVVSPVDDSKVANFELRAVNPMKQGMVRVAMSNNCSTGQNPQYCDLRQKRDQSAYTKLLRDHSDAYPTGKADIRFTFPVMSENEEELRLNFNWAPAYMSNLASGGDSLKAPGLAIPRIELLMFATPHHQERLRPGVGSSNVVLKDVGCVPTIHGKACPVTGGYWSLVEHLHTIGFRAAQPIRESMIPDIIESLQVDLEYKIPDNYMHGAGDTYFAGKMLAKLARVLLIADEISEHEGGEDLGVGSPVFEAALDRLRAGTEIWLNGSAASPLLYDKNWGGVVMCGCDFNGDTQRCNNAYPDCPALVDAGQNFGAGFYNDHHFHFGYHIYAAAVVSKFDSTWARQNFQRVLLLVRDIANPSVSDPHFPTWRHKDWYLGFSWASGIVTIQGNPYPNGRNQESSSEAISAYEAVALFGDVLSKVYAGSADPEDEELCEASARIRDMGRLLLATEVRSAKTYWHVQDRSTAGVSRIYPDVYAPKVVGMLWSMLAQEQTWFGSEPWKSYGIQLLPLTVASEQRDSPSWVKEMLPLFSESCAGNQNCEGDGWSVLVMSSMATIGLWEGAREGTLKLNDSVFEAAGGNGHSRSNTLWYIATRPDPDYNVN